MWVRRWKWMCSSQRLWVPLLLLMWAACRVPATNTGSQRQTRGLQQYSAKQVLEGTVPTPTPSVPTYVSQDEGQDAESSTRDASVQSKREATQVLEGTVPTPAPSVPTYVSQDEGQYAESSTRDASVQSKREATQGSRSQECFPKNTAAMCALTRDQHEDLREWIDHHLRLGFATIYLYDHGSHPPLLDTVLDYVFHGVVVYIRLTEHLIKSEYIRLDPRHPLQNGPRNHTTPQMFVYHHCLVAHGQRHKWLAFFDTDEFLILKNRDVKDIATFLEDYAEYGGLVVRWRVFGSNGHMTRPKGGILANYQKCHLEKWIHGGHVKTIVNTDYVRSISEDSNPHYFLYKEGFSAVDESFKPVINMTCNCTTDKVVLNHYINRSWDDYVKKMGRGGSAGKVRTAKEFHRVDKYATENCSDASWFMERRFWEPPLP